MTRIYNNPGVGRRAGPALLVLLAFFLYGLRELWAAWTHDDATALFFGTLFIGGALYGVRSTLSGVVGLVTALDIDPASGEAVISMWRPFRPSRIVTRLDRLSDWSFWVEAGSRQRLYWLFAREPSYPDRLRFLLDAQMAVPEVLREAAGEAIENFERETGRRRHDED